VCCTRYAIFSYKFYSYEIVTDNEIQVTMLSNNKMWYSMIESNNTKYKQLLRKKENTISLNYTQKS